MLANVIAALLFSGVIVTAVAVVGAIVYHEHRSGMARVRRYERRNR